jgi:hypothetical protein
MTQIRDAFKTKGSAAHDVGALPKGHAPRNVSDYAWYNNNDWVDLFPKLALRVLSNVKFTGYVDFLKKNWDTLTLDFDGYGVPEGYPDEVKNAFDKARDSFEKLWRDGKSSRRGVHTPRPLTPPYVRFRIRRFISTVQNPDVCREAKQVQADQRVLLEMRGSYAPLPRSTKDRGRCMQISTPVPREARVP